MAVEAQNLNLFPTQVFNSRELLVNDVNSNFNMVGVPIGYGVMTSEMTPVSRKRSRDSINPHRLPSFPDDISFLGEDISYQMQLQQLQIDRFIAQNTEKLRLEIEERRKRQTLKIMVAMEENIMKKLKSKEEEIEKIGKLNWALEERIKSLCVENQIWRDLAQTNEATANTLRFNLEQVLAQVHSDDAAAIVEDAQSCCGSNDDEIERRTIVGAGTSCSGGGSYKSRMCRSCGGDESSVLLLPCRHLCLCTVCGSIVHTCPVCNSIKTASVHVNLSF